MAVYHYDLERHTVQVHGVDELTDANQTQANALPLRCEVGTEYTEFPLFHPAQFDAGRDKRSCHDRILLCLMQTETGLLEIWHSSQVKRSSEPNLFCSHSVRKKKHMRPVCIRGR